jgi:hypothetical protein
MAIVHFRAQIIGGSRSAVSAAAYRHSASLFDQSLDRTWNFTAKSASAYSEFGLPADAPTWLRDAAAGTRPAAFSEFLWNKVHATETRYDAQYAREFVHR